MRVATVPLHGWLATPTRRNALKGIFIAPAILMLGVAVQSKSAYMDLERLVDNRNVDQYISAYVEVVRATDAVLARGKRDSQEIDRVSRMWIEGADKGRLKALPLETYNDAIHVGVKGQILASAKGLSHALIVRANKSTAERRYGDAAGDLVTACLILQPLRYSDLTSVAVVSGHQRRILRELADLWPKVDEKQRSKLCAQLEAVRRDKKRFDEVVRQERRVAVVENSYRIEVAHAMGQSKPELDVEAELPMLTKVAESVDIQSGEIIDGIADPKQIARA